MQHWVREVGQELRDVKVQISFFQGYVDRVIHRTRQGPAP